MKNILKKIRLFRKINAAIKAKQMELHIGRLEKSMKGLSITETYPRVTANVKTLLWIGENYQQDHSGFIQSLEKIANVVYFTKSDGSYGLIKQPENSSQLIFDSIISAHRDRIFEILSSNKIDLVIGQMWASTISPQLLNEIRAKGIPVINIAMDDKLPYHWRFDNVGRRNGAIGLASGVDLTLNTTKEASEWYQKLGYACIYWPLAGSPSIFYPRSNRNFDVVFIGSRYGYRDELIRTLLDRGINVTTFGPGWPAGPCTASESADIFGRAKIILGIGYIGHSKKLVTIKQRDFDAIFTGALYITSRNSDLEEILVDGEHIIYYDNKADMVNKISYYLNNESERVSIATNAINEGLRKHTWDIRLSETFRKIGIVSDITVQS